MPLNEQEQEVLEPLRGFRINGDAIELFVVSNGCTDKESFTVKVNTGFAGVSPVELAVIRVRPDTCKMLPSVVQVTFKKSELGIDGLFEVTLANKFGDISSGS